MAPRKNPLKYVTFEVKHGYFGLLGDQNVLLRSCLPVKSKQTCTDALLVDIDNAEFDRSRFKNLQEQIATYFKGCYADFSDVAVDLKTFNSFSRKILTACQKIRFGQTMTYGQIAKIAGSIKGARAAGNVLAKNPVPLIIPCHRVVCSNGGLGGFSAAGGTKIKKILLDLEKKVIRDRC
ncbi:MAG: MGMT family protein [Sedimentisphaerales bacterium]|nr:MGMT family protein [Sedimentisphaerales bacterium]